MKRHTKIALSLITGVLVCFSFPTLILGWHAPELGWMGWLALVPLFVVVRKSTPREAFIYTFVAGLVWYAGSLFWVYRAMNTFGKLSAPVSVVVLILLVLILSAYTAIAPMAARFIERRWRGELLVWLPVCWTAIDFLKNYMPCNGFPWSNVAMSQWRSLLLIQVVDLVGVYGLTFALVLVNVFIATGVARLSGERVRTFFSQGIFTVVVLFVVAGYGLWRLPKVEFAAERAPGIRVGLLQGNIPQEEKWGKDKATANLNTYRQGVRKMSELVDLVIWPEASYPWPMDVEIAKIDPQVLGYPGNVMGTLPYVMIGVVTEKDDENYYTSALLFDAQGTAIERYHKMHLVPFGEYVPYKKVLFFARKLTEPVGNFLAGTSYEPLWADPARIGVLICYEDIFPEIARRMVKSGATLLVNLTNDAWYGISSAPYQHLALSVFRAVENRRYLLRATNTGVSAMISPSGRVLVESGLFESSVIVTSVGLLRNLSPYTRLGDWFAWACLVYAGLGISMALVKKWRRARERKS